MDQAAALKLVYDAIDAANELRREGDQIPKAPDVLLVGKDGILDSLALATLLLSVERQIEDETGETVYILDENADDAEAQLARIETPAAFAALIVEKLG